MKKKIPISIFFILISTFLVAQSVGINNNTPHNSAIIDIRSSTKGILIPRTSTASRNAIPNPAKGLMIYDTTSAGFWFHNGSAWAQLAAGLNAWNLTGNAATNPASHFIGTTDAQPLRFRVNDSWAGEIHATSGNVFFGLGAGQANTTGANNTAVGMNALFANTDGAFNTATGVDALSADNTGSFNNANGYGALYSNTTGIYNNANGYRALYSNTTGGSNNANGASSLFSNTTGLYNTANGAAALFYNNTGNNNTACGAQALYYNTTGNNNTATGTGALYSNTNGIENAVNGYQALFFNTGGNYNTASGYRALYSNTTAFSNTAVGHQALYSNTTGAANTANGSLALYSNTTGSDNTATGLGALINNTSGTTNTAIGTSALTGNTGGNKNIAIGYSSGTHPNAGNIYNTVSIGNDGLLNGYQNQVIIGNSSTGFIGGVVTWSVVSDARIKNTITEDVKGLDFIARLRPVTYHISNKAITTLTGNKDTPDFPGKYDGEKVKYTGFLAQEVEQAAKAAGYEFSGYAAPKNQWGLYTISYEQFVVPLVKGMQEQQLNIEKLNRQVEALRAEVPMQTGKQQAVIEALKKQMADMKKEIELLKK